MRRLDHPAPAPQHRPIVERLDAYLLRHRVPGWLVGGGCLALVLAIGWLDYLTGTRLSLVVLYVVPVAAAAWLLRAPVAYAIAVIAGLENLVDVVFRAEWPPDAVESWNAVVHVAFYAFVVWLVANLHRLVISKDRLATTDPLTGALNRRAFITRATAELERASRSPAPTALLYLDVDGLKRVNDADGHDAGDELLLRFIAVLDRSVRVSDVVGRLGGDEFAVLLPDTDEPTAIAAAERILGSFDAEAGTPSLRASIGAISISTADVGDRSVESLLMRADEAMYRAKRAGGHRVATGTTT